MKTIQEMAREAGIITNSPYLMPHDYVLRGIERFAALVREEAQRKPLTEEKIQDALEAEFLNSDAKRNWHDDVRVARAIEAAHDIKENT